MKRVQSIALLVLLLLSQTLHGQSNDADHKPELERLNAVIDFWRSVKGIRAEIEWTYPISWSVAKVEGKSTVKTDGSSSGAVQTGSSRVPDGMKEIKATMVFLAQGRKYRITSDFPDKPALSSDLAFDESQFQHFSKESSTLYYSKKEKPEVLAVQLPFLPLQSLSFLASKEKRLGNMVKWPYLFDDKLVHDRLSSGIVGSLISNSAKTTIVTFDGGKIDGAQVFRRLVVDGPDGQPSRIATIDIHGKVLFESLFEYEKLTSNANRSIPTRVKSFDYDSNGKVRDYMDGEVKKFEINPTIAEDAFTIDLLSANTVIDLDQRKVVKGLDLEARPPSIGSAPSKVDLPENDGMSKGKTGG